MRNLILIVLLFWNSTLLAQNKPISGYVYDQSNGEYLYGATIYDSLTGKGTTTNSYGFFSLSLSQLPSKLRISFIGFKSQYIEVSQGSNLPLRVELTPSAVGLKELIIKSSTNELDQGEGLSKMTLNARTIRSVPALGGIPDPLKVIQLLPGISRGVEGTSDFFVRGGSPDQNLILLDGIPVYNPSHLLGFLSVFNPDAIQNIEISKGAFPARYGGRLSSVLDIQLKEGNKIKHEGSFTLGLLSTHLHLEGPIGNSEKTSYLLALRRSNIDMYAGALRQLTGENIASLGFYDVNAKVMHRFNEKQKIFLSYYSGRDSYSSRFERSTFEDDFGIRWGNHTASLRWNAQLSASTFMNLTLGYTNYNFGVDSNSENRRSTGIREISTYNYSTKIDDKLIKLDLDTRLSHWNTLRYGANVTYHDFQPSVVNFSFAVNDMVVNEGQFRDVDISTRESYVYVEEELKIGPAMLNAGLHMSNFRVRQKEYYSLQPRTSATIQLGENAIQASYSRMNQFIHLLANSSSGLPTDIWVPSTDQIGPQVADQLSLGYSRKFSTPITIKWSTEAFYKQMNHLIEFKNSTDFFKDGPETNFLTETNEGWEDRVSTGRGWAYGLENLIQWETEKWTGWIAYTLSKSDRQFEEINRGQVFPYRFDRRHDLSIFVSAPLRGRWLLSTTWVYQSGHRVTLPEGSFLEKKFNLFNDNDVRFVSDIIEFRNNYKMPDYHRLDLSLTHRKPKLKGEREWSISVYNVYARNNAFAVFLDNTNPAILRPSVYQLSLFTILPSVAYRYAF